MSEEKRDTSTDFIWLIVIFFSLAYGIVYFFADQIKFIYLLFKLYELKLVALLASVIGGVTAVNTAIASIEQRPVASWSWGEIAQVGSFVGLIINWAFLSWFGWIIYRIWKKNPYKKLTRKLDMFGLMKSEKKVWPFLTPIGHLNLLNEDMRSGPYAMALQPIEFVTKYKLLDRPKELTSLNKMKTEKLFSSQLGKLWDGVDNLNSYTQALFAIFAAQAMAEEWPEVKDAKGKPVKSIDEARNVLKKIASSTDGGKRPDFSLANHLVERYKKDARVLAIMNKHAYIYTALGSLYQAACKKGVLPPNNIYWLKPINRQMYYFLNCVGRRVPFVEVAGIFGHWKAEKVCRHPIEKPFVTNSRKGLEMALQEIKLAAED